MLDISTCSQMKKDILYKKAHTAFASQEGRSAYYPLIQPYLVGASVEELKKLARSQVAMDIDTFINLNPEELKKLSVQDVKDLLGVNLPHLKEVENHPSVAMWIKNHFQSELDTLGIGLMGGAASLSSTSMGSTVSSMSVGTNSNNAVTTNSPVIPIMESTFSSPGNIHITTTSSDLNPFIFRDVTEFHSTPIFKIAVTTNEMSYSIDNTQTTASAKDSKDAFPINVSSNVTAVPDNTMARTIVPTTARNTAVSTEITIDSKSTTTNRTNFPVSGTPVPFTARRINTTTSKELTTDSNNITANSTTTPSITIKSSISVPTEVVVPSLNITATLNETGDILVPTISTTSRIVVNGTTYRTVATDFNSSTASRTVLPSISTDSTTVVPTTSLNVTAISDGALFPSTARDFSTTISSKPVTDSNNTTVSAPVLTTVTLDSTTAVTTKTRAVSFNVSATLNDTISEMPIPYTAIDGNVIPSVETTVASDSNATSSHTAFPSTATDRDVTAGVSVTISHSPTISINFTVGADTTTRRTYLLSPVMPNITRTSSEQHSTPPKHVPTATNPASVSKKPIKITDKPPTASHKTTFHSQETAHKTAVPPRSSPNQTATKAAASAQSSSSKAPPRRKPPSYPTPNGYINVKPLSASASNTFSWTFLALSLTIEISIQKFL
ncbi:mucin-2-like [Candoia aspera]|uniref:mucin-2-like n=1 Tax=Candoia aspera TaxID=51853 RepID=UPI002FD7E9AF